MLIYYCLSSFYWYSYFYAVIADTQSSFEAYVLVGCSMNITTFVASSVSVRLLTFIVRLLWIYVLLVYLIPIHNNSASFRFGIICFWLHLFCSVRLLNSSKRELQDWEMEERCMHSVRWRGEIQFPGVCERLEWVMSNRKEFTRPPKVYVGMRPLSDTYGHKAREEWLSLNDVNRIRQASWFHGKCPGDNPRGNLIWCGSAPTVGLRMKEI